MLRLHRHIHSVATMATLVLAASVLLCGCPKQPAETISTPPEPTETSTAVSVLVSEDLAEPFAAVQASFAQASPEVAISAVVGPAGEIREKVISGEAQGYLLSLGPAELTPLDQAQKIEPGSQITIAEVSLCVVAPADNPLGLATLEDLAKPEVKKIALGDKQAGSVATEAKGALQKAKLWGKVEPKAVRVPLAGLVAEVAEGRADAAVVARHQANAEGVTVVAEIDPAAHQPITLLAIRTAGYDAGDAGSKLAEFLASEQGRKPFIDAGLTAPAPVAEGGDGVELLWFCGAGIRKPADECIKVFKEKTGITIRPTYTGSGCLLAQITMGQTGDLYMPGEDYYMKQADERGFISEYKNVSYFVPVIMVQKGNPKKINGLEDLFQPGLRVGIGEGKSCAIGSFTVRVMEANGLSMDELKKNVVFESATAPELGNAIKLDAIDAAIQWDAVAGWYLEDADAIAFPVTEQTISPIVLGTLKFSKHPAEAKQFLDFVASDEGKAIFLKHGHTVDPARPVFPVAEVAGD